MEKKIFSFLFNTEFYYGISKETIRMPFRGLAMLKSTKLIIKGGLCYRFAMVSLILRIAQHSINIITTIFGSKSSHFNVIANRIHHGTLKRDLLSEQN